MKVQQTQSASRIASPVRVGQATPQGRGTVTRLLKGVSDASFVIAGAGLFALGGVFALVDEAKRREHEVAELRRATHHKI